MPIPLQSEAPKFKCNACGSCCSRIRGIMPQEDKDFIKKYAFGRLPVVQLVPVEQMTFPLWDWEAKRFSGWQHEAGIDAEIKPLRAVMDLNSNKAIIISYFMDSKTDACPFLKNSKCSIYHTKRAYVCRLFPFNRSPFIKQDSVKDDTISKNSMFGECSAMEHILPCIPNEFGKMIRFLYEAFPDSSFLSAVQNDIVVEWANMTVVDLMRKKIVKPAMNYPHKFLVKRIGNAEKIDFTDFLTESGYMAKTEMKNLLNRFDNNMDAEEKLGYYKH